MTIDITEI